MKTQYIVTVNFTDNSKVPSREITDAVFNFLRQRKELTSVSAKDLANLEAIITIYAEKLEEIYANKTAGDYTFEGVLFNAISEILG